MINWLVNQNNYSLLNNDIHLVKVFIPTALTHYDYYWSLLSADEQERALRYRFEKDRNQSVISRGILRELTSRYLALDPKQIIFSVTQHGKLFLENNSFEFNVSHSHEYILYSFTLNTAIGVDIEYAKDDIDFAGIAKRFFSAQEYADFATLSLAEQPLGFYNAWTRKEAYIKAIGEGLSHPLESFDVTLLPNQIAKITRIAVNPAELSEWTLQAFTPDKDYFAAFATKQKVNNVFTYCY
jgi:4'-phosphopantetheinyl transferase